MNIACVRKVLARQVSKRFVRLRLKVHNALSHWRVFTIESINLYFLLRKVTFCIVKYSFEIYF